jgi:hypothetical protein
LEDWPARIIAGAGVGVGLFSVALTAFLWFRSGPSVKVSAFVRAERAAVHIQVANTGRIAATIRRVELRDQTTVRGPSGGDTATFSRWSIQVEFSADGMAVELAPTAFIEVEFPVADVLTQAAGASTVKIAAWAERGDGKWSSSKPIQLR